MDRSFEKILDRYKSGDINCGEAEKLIKALWQGETASDEGFSVPWHDDKLRLAVFKGSRLVKKGAPECRDVQFTMDGNALNVECWGSLKCNDIKGNVSCGGSTGCGNVGGSVSCGGGASCRDVGGSVSCGGSASCGTVKGDVKAGGSVKIINNQTTAE